MTTVETEFGKLIYQAKVLPPNYRIILDWYTKSVGYLERMALAGIR